MSGSYNHTNPFQVSNPSRPSYIMASGETKGACFDCPGKNHEKKCDGCENCARLKKGRADCWDPTKYTYSQEGCENIGLDECEFPECERRSKNNLCGKCQELVNRRNRKWEKLHPGIDAPKDYLYASRKKRSNLQDRIKSNYHPKDRKYIPINDYTKKLRKVKKMGYDCLEEAAKDLYFKLGSTRKVGKELGMSSQATINFLKKIGVTLKRPGYHRG